MATLLEKFQKFNENHELIQTQKEESVYRLDDLAIDTIDNPNDIEDIIMMSYFYNLDVEPINKPKYSIYKRNKSNDLIKEDINTEELKDFIKQWYKDNNLE